MDLERTIELFRALQQAGVKYVLVGGVALNLHGIARATEDVDLFVHPDSENVEKLKQALRSVWRDPAIDEIHAEDLAGSYATIRYGTPDEGMVVDILAGLGDAIRYEDLEVQVLEWEKVRIPLATPRTLYRIKRGTPRPQDKADALLLQEKFGLEGK